MEYTVQKLSRLAGVSARTLRYYDEIGLLKPARISSSGYRIYGSKEVNTLQQILFYREFGIPLDEIKRILDAPDYNKAKALKEHREKLISKRRQLDLLIRNVEKTIAETEGRLMMTDKEKFEGFKKQCIQENEEKYGREIRDKYGEEAVESSNRKFMNMTQEQYEDFCRLGEELLETLKKAFATGDPAGEEAQKAADMHRRWLLYTWPSYTKEAHAGLAQMYVDDERFTQYYDKMQPGLAGFLRDAVFIYTGMDKQQ
ncbi:MAG TPA: MerR family transcriptional regulator [Candidatus Atribacteria bacterium]|nr:MerR family transcriptional regulator [Candidatus Atribacteria bacterium]